jgi:hypothetical protein
MAQADLDAGVLNGVTNFGKRALFELRRKALLLERKNGTF